MLNAANKAQRHAERAALKQSQAIKININLTILSAVGVKVAGGGKLKRAVWGRGSVWPSGVTTRIRNVNAGSSMCRAPTVASGQPKSVSKHEG